MFKAICLLAVLGCAMAFSYPEASYQNHLNNKAQYRVKRGDFYGPGGLGAGGGGYGFGFVGSSFNPVLFQGGAVAGGFANEALKANSASLAGGLGDAFGVSYYASTIAGAAASNAASLGKHKGGATLTYGRR